MTRVLARVDTREQATVRAVNADGYRIHQKVKARKPRPRWTEITIETHPEGWRVTSLGKSSVPGEVDWGEPVVCRNPEEVADALLTSSGFVTLLARRAAELAASEDPELYEVPGLLDT